MGAVSVDWQVYEAKQRFSEVLRAVAEDGPQTITRHGEAIAVIIDIAEFHRLTQPRMNLTELLKGPPYLDDDAVQVLGEFEGERKRDFPRAIALEADE
nr:type II toxin-antitoxin system Phd/YefM family antitoxin [Phytoactinopolyspora mesophila]